MKPMHGSVRKILAVIVGLTVMASAISIHAEKAGAAKVIRIKGSARYTLDHHTWKELKIGTVLKGAVLVQTAPGSTVDLCLNEGRAKISHDGMQNSTDNVIRIFENSIL